MSFSHNKRPFLNHVKQEKCVYVWGGGRVRRMVFFHAQPCAHVYGNLGNLNADWVFEDTKKSLWPC